ncbi:MAG: sugar ABC transporter permease [Kosmotogaceae bacterium]|nr:sugar ABC transporter permease [Kosmotogaceae bacterium]
MRKMAKSRIREARVGLLFLSPWLIGLGVFTAYPIIASLYFSFTYYSGLSSPRWVGLDNYLQLFKDPLFWKSIYNTLYLAIIGIPLAQALSLLVALLLNTKVKFLGIFRTLYFLPSIVPAVATALLWKWFLNPQFGPVNLLLEKIGLPTPGWLTDPLWSKPALIFTSIWGVGGAMVIYLAGLQNIPAELYEAAELDGAGKLSKFSKITLPMLSPVILFNVVMGTINSFQSFTSVFIMTGGGPENSTLVYALSIYRNGFQFYKMGYASAMAWILLIMTSIAIFFVFKFFGRYGYFGGVDRS